MTSIIVASHGDFAAGIVQSVSMIAGPQDNVKTVSLQPKMTAEEFYANIDTAVADLGNPEELLIFVDLKGGTPYNQCKKYIEDHDNKYTLIAGVNLPMLLDSVFGCMFGGSAADVAQKALKTGASSVFIN